MQWTLVPPPSALSRRRTLKTFSRHSDEGRHPGDVCQSFEWRAYNTSTLAMCMIYKDLLRHYCLSPPDIWVLIAHLKRSACRLKVPLLTKLPFCENIFSDYPLIFRHLCVLFDSYNSIALVGKGALHSLALLLHVWRYTWRGFRVITLNVIQGR